MNTPTPNTQRYTQERVVGSQKQVFDAHTGRWVSVSMALLDALAQESQTPESPVLNRDSSD
jgi:hypothetical protein